MALLALLEVQQRLLQLRHPLLPRQHVHVGGLLVGEEQRLVVILLPLRDDVLQAALRLLALMDKGRREMPRRLLRLLPRLRDGRKRRRLVRTA